MRSNAFRLPSRGRLIIERADERGQTGSCCSCCQRADELADERAGDRAGDRARGLSYSNWWVQLARDGD